MDDADDFCRRHWPGLVSTLTAYTGDAVLAQDLAQDALAKVLLRWNRVRRMASPGGYAYRVGVNMAKDALRAQAREHPDGSGEHARPAVTQDHALRLDIDAALAALPARQRLAVSLRYLADLSIAQTAGVMRCRPGTVRALCHQATQALRSSPELAWQPITASGPHGALATTASEEANDDA